LDSIKFRTHHDRDEERNALAPVCVFYGLALFAVAGFCCRRPAPRSPMRLPRLTFLVSGGAIAHHGWFGSSELKASLGKFPDAEL
jgi:hypothetical protein